MTERTITAPPMANTQVAPWVEMRSALILATAVAATAELVILRVFTRTLVHIPGVALDTGLFSVVAEAGRLAYYASVVLLIALLASVGRSLVRAGHLWGAAAVALFLIFGAGARIGLLDAAGVSVAEVLAVVFLAGIAIRRSRSARPAVAALAGAVVVHGLWAIGSQASTAGLVLPEASTSLLPFAEVLVLLGFASLPLSIALPATMRRLDRVALAVALAAGLALFAGLQLADANVKILLLWNLGLAGYLPSLAYALVAAGAAGGLALAVRTGQTHLAAAIAMILAGGFALTSTYQSGLLIAAFGVLAIVPVSARDGRVADGLGRDEADRRRDSARRDSSA